ncbi:ArsC family reductase [Alteromonas facilis]|uniref:ArsC family reductase n=1 Tax=Alteromonas facilis TaxID=2048004 RepID=UPI000C286D5B|nr:ArsC family reductase [Alteromonas facilis]
MTITLYGIKNCDTVKKAKKWLEQHNIDFTFHDFREDGIDSDWVASVEQQVGWETLLNKRGTTFRQLDEQVKASVNEHTAIQLMADNPTLIKRPVLIADSKTLVGFKPEIYAEALNQ